MIIFFAGVPGAPEQTEYKLKNLNRWISFFDVFPFYKGGRLVNLWDFIKRKK